MYIGKGSPPEGVSLKMVEARGVEPLLGQKESMVIHGSP
jgi:hypothetical protein